TRGLLLGTWPVIPLGIRFSVLFAVSALLPVSLLIICSLAFMNESGNSARNVVSNNLKRILEGIDSARERLSGNFQASFLRLLQNPELRERLRSGGMEAADILTFVRNQFCDESGRNQLAFAAITDSQGRIRILHSKRYTSSDLDGVMRFCRTGLVQALRLRRVQKAGPASVGPDPMSGEDRAFIAGYEGATGNKLHIEMEETRSIPFDYQIKRSSVNMLYDFVAIDGADTYGVIIGWNADDLARKIILNGMEDARAQLPGSLLGAFRSQHGRMTQITPGSRHDPASTVLGLRRVARQAAQRNGPVIENTAMHAVVAMPSRGFKDIVLAASADFGEIVIQERRNLILLSFLAMVCMLIVLLAGKMTARRILSPIQSLRGALENVGHGDLTTSITDSRPDELGRLTEAFGTMVKGLRERQRLAALVSDHAIAALETAEDPGMAMGATSFDGVILISDIRGFTPLCETQEPAHMTALLNRHFDEMSPIIAAAGGRIDKFIGDAIQ
ncbi:MAG TPA: HAMP domain-containing protein, partial [Candidatus Ozemobacteraceae bacterium]|nr:HAMP domain-containing protein [Candidatus Ozemobacteraceae bacterium]